jgi:hypothetical protein
MVPNNTDTLLSKTYQYVCLDGDRDFAGVIKSMDHKKEILYWWDQFNYMSP